jgi:hypothetical protein
MITSELLEEIRLQALAELQLEASFELVCTRCAKRSSDVRGDSVPVEATEQHQACLDCADSTTACEKVRYFDVLGREVF